MGVLVGRFCTKVNRNECFRPGQARRDPQHNTMLKHLLDIGMSVVDSANLSVQACAELGLLRKLVQPWRVTGGGGSRR